MPLICCLPRWNARSLHWENTSTLPASAANKPCHPLPIACKSPFLPYVKWNEVIQLSPIRSVMKWPYCLNCAIFPPNKKELHGEQCAVRLDLSTKCAQACAMRHTRFDRWSAVLVFLRGQMASEQKRICSVAGSAA